MKEKLTSWTSLKLSKIFSVKETINRMKSEATDLEKILSKHKSDKGLITNTHKKLLKLSKEAAQFKNG